MTITLLTVFLLTVPPQAPPLLAEPPPQAPPLIEDEPIIVAVKPKAPVVVPRGLSNVGVCRCQVTAGACYCKPASICPQGCPESKVAVFRSPDSADRYDKALAIALARGRTLLVCVGMEAETCNGCDCVRYDEMPGVTGPCVVVSVPWTDDKGARMTWERTEVGKTPREVAGELKAVSRLANPFPVLPSARHDDNLEVAGPWPSQLEKPKGFVRYKRANYTQDIAVTNDVDRVYAVPRSGLLAKWHQSGGLEGIDTDEFRSDLYKNEKAAQVRTFVADIQVKNSLGYFQPNRGYKRQYPDGSKFLDVLSNKDGKVFEIRQREKLESAWDNTILFKDEKARPVGYTGLKVACASCHSEAGTGSYASGLVPGGDETLSDPITPLEDGTHYRPQGRNNMDTKELEQKAELFLKGLLTKQFERLETATSNPVLRWGEKQVDHMLSAGIDEFGPTIVSYAEGHAEFLVGLVKNLQDKGLLPAGVRLTVQA